LRSSQDIVGNSLRARRLSPRSIVANNWGRSLDESGEGKRSTLGSATFIWNACGRAVARIVVIVDTSVTPFTVLEVSDTITTVWQSAVGST
jgi:hypothetical protein